MFIYQEIHPRFQSWFKKVCFCCSV